MKTLKHLAFATAITLTFLGCKKKETVSLTNDSLTANSENTELNLLKPVPQKYFDIKGKELANLIKQFKQNVEPAAQNSQARLIEADSLTIDSALFVLEAALNYDYDFVNSNSNISYEAGQGTQIMHTIQANSNNTKISSDDLESAYEQMKAQIETQLTGSSKIKIIDVEVFANELNQVAFKSIPVLWIVSYSDCSPITQTGIVGGWLAVPLSQSPPSSQMCTTNVVFASDLIMQKLNKCYFGICYNVSQFYVNIVGVNFNAPNTPAFNNPYITTFYSSPVTQFTSFVDAPCTSIGPPAINTRVSNFVTLGNNNKPTTSHKPLNVQIKSNAIFNTMAPNSPTPYFNWWHGSITYGVPAYFDC